MYIRSIQKNNMEKQDKRFSMPVYDKSNLIDFTNRNIWLGQIEGHGTRITTNPVAFFINCIGHGINNIKEFIMGKPKRINPKITGYALELITHFPNIHYHDLELVKSFLIGKYNISLTTFEEAYKEAKILDQQ